MANSAATKWANKKWGKEETIWNIFDSLLAMEDRVPENCFWIGPNPKYLFINSFGRLTILKWRQKWANKLGSKKNGEYLNAQKYEMNNFGQIHNKNCSFHSIHFSRSIFSRFPSNRLKTYILHLSPTFSSHLSPKIVPRGEFAHSIFFHYFVQISLKMNSFLI